MHSNVIRDLPGVCPVCGMNLVEGSTQTIGHTFQKHEGHDQKELFKKFFVVSVITLFILIFSGVFDRFLWLHLSQSSSSQIVLLILGSLVFFYGGTFFIFGAYRELRAKLPGMMTLISLALIASYFFSVYVFFTGVGHALFGELSTLTSVMLLGHWIEMKAIQGTQGALKELAKLLPDTAEVLENSTTRTVLISEIGIGNQVLVRPGARVPADGVVIDGQSEIDESVVTGESAPSFKRVGDEVIAGSLNTDGSLVIEVKKKGGDTFLSGVMRLVSQAEQSKSRLQVLSDRAAFYLTGIAVVSGGLTFGAWLFSGAPVFVAIERLVAVLVIACPHALGLAVPLVASLSTSIAARNGFLVRSRTALESARKIDVVLFDKTGTLTTGVFSVEDVIPVPSFTVKEVLRRAAAVNQNSEHPLAKAIIAEARNKKVLYPEVQNFERIGGLGVRGGVSGETVLVGSESFLAENMVTIPTEILQRIQGLEDNGKTVVFVAIGSMYIGAIALADVVREESFVAVKDLRKLGIRVAMITGDGAVVARRIAKSLGIEEYFSEVLPHQKSEKVKLLQQKGYRVAMVGDGINDAPALAQADIGIAVGAGTNVAIESAGIILAKNDPRDITKIIRLSQVTYEKMIQNIFWATGYNLVALPIAAGVLIYRGITISPTVAAVLMSASTVVVALNALLLRKKSLVLSRL